MKPMIWAWMVATAIAGSAQAQSPYAADLLAEERAKQPLPKQACAPLDKPLAGQAAVLSMDIANTLLCHAVQDIPLAEDVWEYGCTERSELIIGTLLHWGVNPAAVGRASTFYDKARNHGGQAVFALEDPAHGEAFNRGWQLVFGNTIKKEIELIYDDQRYLLDVDGTVQWNIGHIAPTLWVQGQHGRELRVLDPLLSPDALLTLEEWRARQHAQPAAIVWGALGDAPDILVEYLSGDMRERFLRAFKLQSFDTIEPEQLNATLRDIPPEMKAEIYAKTLDIEEDSAWHPLHWRGYSFAGDSLPDWDVQNEALMQQRYDAALRKLAPLRAYQQMREQYADDEAFLNAVRARMIAQDEDAKSVFIDFSEPY